MATESKMPSSADVFAGRTVAVVGLGMLGGSLGLALHRLPKPPRVLGWARRLANVREALAAGVIDAGDTDVAAVLPQADLTVICLPVQTTSEFVRSHARHWRSGSAVTDVGSTKHQLVAAATPVLAARSVHFVGSHPMAGSEQSGLQHATADLYRNACVFLTPDADTDPGAAALVEALWQRLGAHTHVLPSERHDALVARTSHALHLISAAVVDAVLQGDQAVLGAAGGFRDVTRIAASSPQMWLEIFQTNRTEVLQALSEFEDSLAEIRSLLERSDWTVLERRLIAAKARRQRWFDEWQKLKGSGPA